jgi:hypothetical protein
MIFVELTPFVDFRAKYWVDEDLRGLQNYLLATPDAGDLIRGGGGVGAGAREAGWGTSDLFLARGG